MNDFDARLKRLEQLHGNGGQRRAELLRRFAGPEYDGHREAIVAALLSDTPHYTFEAETETGVSAYLVNRGKTIVLEDYDQCPLPPALQRPS